MRTRGRSQPPQWLIIVVAIVGSLGLLAAALKYIDGGSTGGQGNGFAAGNPGRSLSKATVQGTARSVEIAGTIRLSSLALDTGSAAWTVRSGEHAIDGTGPVTIAGEGITADVFRTFVGLDHITFSPRSNIVALPDKVTVNGAAVEGSRIQLELSPGTAPAWLDAPLTIGFDSVDQFSWAGSGEIAVADQHLSSEFLGGMGSMKITLTRTLESIALAGTGGLQQAFVDGQPALNTKADIERVRADVTVHLGDPNQTSYVTWAPRNKGTFGMCILRVSPQSEHADWVNVGLQHMPPMFGGEQHSPTGGDTSGLGGSGRLFGGPDAIDSFIGVGDADRRDLSISVPGSTTSGVYTIAIAIEGNFDAVVFSMTVTVLA